MLILALDTTTRAGSAALLLDDDVLAVRAGDGRRPHGERLPGELQQLLADAAQPLEAVELFVVASGPGAFTALRIGLATVQGIAAVLRRPVIGVSALEALACATWSDREGVAAGPGVISPGSGPPPMVASWMDAHRGEVYAALYARSEPDADGLPWRELRAPAVGRPEHILRLWSSDLDRPTVFSGDAAAPHAALLETLPLGGTVARQVPLLAPFLGWIGRRRAMRGQGGSPHTLQPLYVRRPDAEIDRDRRARP